jgi:hypothetical protein
MNFEGGSPSDPIDVDLYASIWEPTVVKELVSVQDVLRWDLILLAGRAARARFCQPRHSSQVQM